MISNPYTNVEKVENELNAKYSNSDLIDPEDVQLFVKINENNYYPINTLVDKYGKFHVDDSTSYAEKQLYAGSKHQFLYKQYLIEEDNKFALKISDDATFATGWDKSKYVMFLNGYLVNEVLFQITIPSIDNEYLDKWLYSAILFNKGDRIDLFYIEGRDNAFEHVRFNQDIYVNCKKVKADVDNQEIVKVPYPYSAYPRNEHMFYVFDGTTKKYLNNKTDYSVADNGEYIFLHDDNILKTAYESYIVFTFPYVKEEFEDEEDPNGVGETTGVSFFASYYTYDEENESGLDQSNGYIKFHPAFDDYKLLKENFLLFRNSTFVQPELYRLVNNNTIQLLDANLIKYAPYDKYTMLIFRETDKQSYRARQFNFNVYQVKVYAGQKTINVPDSIPKDSDFLVFNGTLFLDMHDKYKWVDGNPQTIQIQDDAVDIKGDRMLTFIFYTNSKKSIKRKTLRFIKLKFETTGENEVYVTNESGYNLKYNKKNFIIFHNGTYLPPDRYDINKSTGKIDFIDKFDFINHESTFTGIFLVSQRIEDAYDDWLYYSILDGDPNKLLWFDEIYAKPVITKK